MLAGHNVTEGCLITAREGRGAEGGHRSAESVFLCMCSACDLGRHRGNTNFQGSDGQKRASSTRIACLLVLIAPPSLSGRVNQRATTTLRFGDEGPLPTSFARFEGGGVPGTWKEEQGPPYPEQRIVRWTMRGRGVDEQCPMEGVARPDRSKLSDPLQSESRSKKGC